MCTPFVAVVIVVLSLLGHHILVVPVSSAQFLSLCSCPAYSHLISFSHFSFLLYSFVLLFVPCSSFGFSTTSHVCPPVIFPHAIFWVICKNFAITSTCSIVYYWSFSWAVYMHAFKYTTKCDATTCWLLTWNKMGSISLWLFHLFRPVNLVISRAAFKPSVFWAAGQSCLHAKSMVDECLGASQRG